MIKIYIFKDERSNLFPLSVVGLVIVLAWGQMSAVVVAEVQYGTSSLVFCRADVVKH